MTEPGSLEAMASDPDVVLRDALALSVYRRARMAAELLASLDDGVRDDPDVVRAEWARELEHRAQRARSGEAPGEPWPDVRDRIRSDLAR